jgi:AcrR family transcriptional regulator
MPRRDPRPARTRAAILRAFDELLFARGYDRVRVHDIAGRARVARSTFYEHYRDKDAVLADSIARPFAPLVHLVDPGAAAAALQPILGHIWENRAHVTILVDNPTRRAVARALAQRIHARLRARALTAARPRRVRLAAIALAEAQLALIAAWLSRELPASAAELAEQLHVLAAPCRAFT